MIIEEGILPEKTENFNKIIESFIDKSNPDSLKRTKANIEKFGQMEAAVVLTDGTLVDGNRRFTALRQLHGEGKGAQFNYIKVVVLGNSYTKKEIKTLELNLQHAQEARVDYNPIDRLVDIYRDLIAPNHQFNLAEYAREVDQTENEVQKDIDVAQLMIDYLDYIKRPNMFYIARQQKLDGSLREIYRILKSKKIASDDYDDVKEILFTILLMAKGEKKYIFRDVRGVVENPKRLRKFVEKLDSPLNDLDKCLSNSIVSENVETEENKADQVKNNGENFGVEVPKELVDQVNEIVGTEIDNNKLNKAEKAPLKALSKAVNYMRESDPQALFYISEKSESDKKSILNLIAELKKQVKQIEDEL